MSVFRPLSETKFINDANLVSYWKLDGNSNDYKNNLNGTDTSMTYGAGKFGSEAIFSGSGYITLPDLSSFIDSSFTITGWVKRSDTKVNEYIWVTQNSESPEIRLYTNYSGGNMTYYFPIYDNGGYQCQLSATIPYDNNPHYITATATTNNFNLYVDGKLYSTDTSGSFNIDGSTEHRFGHYSLSSSEKLIGSLDDFAIFSRALSASEVNELYQGMTYGEYLGSGSATTKLLLHLNGNSTDSSGNGNNGTDTNVTYPSGRFGLGAKFSGNGLITSNTQPFSVNENRTMSLWVKIETDKTGSTASYNCLFSLVHNKVAYSFIYARQLDNSVYKNQLYATRDRIGVGSDYVPLNDVTAAHGWYNIILTLSGNTLSFYVDSKLIGSVTISTNDGSLDFGVGYRVGSINAQNYSSEYIDEIINENRAWTQKEISKYYTMTKGYYATL